MLHLFLPALLALSPQAPAAQPAPAEARPLSYFTQRYPFRWNQMLPVGGEVDGLKIDTIFFDRRTFASGFLKGADFGTRAQVAVTNTSKTSKNPGFAVAVFDAEDRLLGVATGGARLGRVAPGDKDTFELNFHEVLERLPKGDHFYLSVELAP